MRLTMLSPWVLRAETSNDTRGFLVRSFAARDRASALLGGHRRQLPRADRAPSRLAYRGNVTRPKDYKQWSTLIHTLVSHWTTRYGIQEVAEWFFEVWNEPNLKAFWTGTQEDYFTLYRVTANAIKTVDPSLKVGGPATARDGWIEEFLEFCERGQRASRFRDHAPLPDRRSGS